MIIKQWASCVFGTARLSKTLMVCPTGHGKHAIVTYIRRFGEARPCRNRCVRCTCQGDDGTYVPYDAKVALKLEKAEPCSRDAKPLSASKSNAANRLSDASVCFNGTSDRSVEMFTVDRTEEVALGTNTSKTLKKDQPFQRTPARLGT